MVLDWAAETAIKRASESADRLVTVSAILMGRRRVIETGCLKAIALEDD